MEVDTYTWENRRDAVASSATSIADEKFNPRASLTSFQMKETVTLEPSDNNPVTEEYKNLKMRQEEIQSYSTLIFTDKKKLSFDYFVRTIKRPQKFSLRGK